MYLWLVDFLTLAGCVFPCLPAVVWCKREMDSLFAAILDDGHNVVGAAKCSLFFVDEEKGELWTKVATDNQGEIKVRQELVLWFRSSFFNLVQVRLSRTLHLAEASVAFARFVENIYTCATFGRCCFQLQMIRVLRARTPPNGASCLEFIDD